MAIIVAAALALLPALARSSDSPDRTTGADGTWSRIGPDYRLAFGHVAIDDPLHGRMIVFGVLGLTADDPEITWAWTRSGGWAPLETIGTPPPRLDSAGAIRDPVRDRMIVFGGEAGYRDLRNQTWALDLSGTPTWSQLEPEGTPPTPRVGLSAIYDPVRDRMIVFGGSDGARRNDVWALELSTSPPTWTQLSPQGPLPAARYYHSAVCDSIGDRMIVFGGSTSGGVVNDVWALSLAAPETWTQLSPSGPLPDARFGASLVYDTAGERVVLFGGEVPVWPYGSYFSDTWTLDLSEAPAWTQLVPAGPSPGARAQHTAVYDPVHEDMAIYGGAASPEAVNNGVDGDLWVLSLSGSPAWEQVMSDHPPPVLNSLDAALYYPVRDLFFVGGSNSCATMSNQTSHEVLSLGTAIPSWTDFNVGPADDGTIVYDQTREEVVSFGGTTCLTGDIYNSTYGKSLIGGPSWSLTDGVLPPKRYQHTAIAASQHDEMLIFGGDPGYGAPLFNDVWALSLDLHTWTPLLPAGTPPPPCTFATSIYDSPRDRMIVFSGRDSLGVWYNDPWALSLSTLTWTTLTPSGTPPHAGEAYYQAVYDGTRDRMLVAGSTTAGVQVWALSLDGTPTWTQLAPAGPVPVSGWGELVAAYDPVHDRLLIQIDSDPNSYIQTETWALTFGEPTSVPAQVETHAGLAIAQQPNPGQALRVAFTLPDTRPATIEAFDVSGRRVAGARFDGIEPGPHTVTLGSGARLAPGLYLVRLSHGGRSAVARAVVVN